MSRKRKSYTAEFKAKCVLELLEGHFRCQSNLFV